MHHSTDYGGIPAGAKTRIVMSVIAGVFFGFLLFEVSVNLNWFTIIRALYLMLGIGNGLLLGFIETRTVIRELNEKTKAKIWQPFAISALTLILPYLVAIGVFGVSEYLPFGAYVVLSAIPAYLATSGWYYYQAEKRDKVSILNSVWGFTYWKEPLPDYRSMFANFVSDLAKRDYWWITNPRGYIGYAKQLKSALESKTNVDPETKEAMMDILRVMDKYRRRGLLLFGAVMVSMAFLGLWIFLLASTNTFGLQQVVNGRIVSGARNLISSGINPRCCFLRFLPRSPTASQEET